MLFKRQPILLVACALAVVAGAGIPSARGAARRTSGAEIYRQQCLKCHGRHGEGVKGKYNDALVGDWSLEKLTRFIDKNMPDDDPEKCTGDDAQAVARYIYDTFYSREARSRDHLARVELVRLTNRQYVNTVADLIKEFTGHDAPLSSARGLPGVYYNSRNNRRGESALEHVDRQISFDFGANNPDWAKTSTNGFSMQWRGSILADESGDYDFIIHTANGVRLWINDDDNPLIDGSVASGESIEHKAAVRLIGGRAYPLRLEYFKAPKDKTASISLHWKPPHGTEQLIEARNFSPERTTPTFVVTTPFPPDDSSVGYERGVAVSPAWDEAATHAAIEVANFVAKQLNRMSHSKPDDTDRAAKLEKFCGQFVENAFRRPLTDEQKKIFISNLLKGPVKFEDAVKRVVLLALKSPRFLYLGLDESKPDDFAVAQRLSFGLWDSIPDAELFKAAGESRLHSREQVAQESLRMLADPRARAKVQCFLHHWLQMDHVEDLAKDPKLFPGFTPEIIADLRTSLNLFLDDAVWNGSSDYRRLLLANDLFLNNRLAKFYGVETNAADDFVKVSFDPKERSGVITHPYLLSVFSYQKSTSPIHRGVFLTRNIVGRSLKPPPMAMSFKDENFAPNLTMREKVVELTRSQACQACHSVINPLGFSLEQYDAVGRFRTRDGNRPIDAASEYTTDDGEKIRLAGGRDLAEFAAGSEQAQNAFIEQLFNQVVKQPLLAYGPDMLDRLRHSFIDSGCNVQKLLVEIAGVSALHGIEKNTSPRKKS
jgi:hypothetical protein